MKAQSTFSLKDELFHPKKVTYLSSLLAEASPDFPSGKFERTILGKLPELELKERIVYIAEVLRDCLPDSYVDGLQVILDSLPPELDPDQSDNDFGDFIFAPFSHFVAVNGCEKRYLKRSLDALEEITRRFSAEDAIRYFINAFPDETFPFLEKCSHSGNYHVRRLASEGTRPKLPWSQKLVTGYERPVSILNRLHSDETRYVTRSVANHLNDISKVDPDLVIELLKRWREENGQTKQELDYMTRHALRTLIKAGHPGALSLLGFAANVQISILRFTTDTPRVEVGNACQLDLELKSHRKQKLLIDYLMAFPDGRRKVFKWKQVSLGKGEVLRITKSHPMRLMTTRSLVPGKHRVVLQINGKERRPVLEFSLALP